MSEAPQRRQITTHQGRVLRTERLTPHMIRVVIGGGLEEFATRGFTDHYVKLLFPRDGVTYPEPFDVEAIREALPREQWPLTRTYTVRAWDPQARELTIDFVYHGAKGVAGPWAAAARPGDPVYFGGPGGGYAPDDDADWHLLAGDESALPAIAATLESLPDDVPVQVFVEVAGSEEEQKLRVPDSAAVRWLHRGDRPVGAALAEAVRGAAFLPGTPQVFAHGEANLIKELRRYLRVERGLNREQLSISGYWRIGADEDAWQAGKREWNAAVEADAGA
ncbi:siderophore-interacting protein [Streptomyces sp. NPDC088801]|uniref:siderophore-interacting protein n=1 Tax=Streptomyces sp. NPDC088801 TaxID=3365903 RepID=UPI00382DF808